MREFEYRKPPGISRRVCGAPEGKHNYTFRAISARRSGARGRTIYIKSYRETSGSGRLLQMAPEL